MALAMRLGAMARILIAVVLAPLVHPRYLLPLPDCVATTICGNDGGPVAFGDGDMLVGYLGVGLGDGVSLGVGARAEWRRCPSPTDTRALVYTLGFSF